MSDFEIFMLKARMFINEIIREKHDAVICMILLVLAIVLFEAHVRKKPLVKIERKDGRVTYFYGVSAETKYMR